MKKILITAAGCPGFISTRNAILSSPFLSDTIIHACDINESSINLKLAQESFTSQRADSPNYVKSIFEYCKKSKIDLVIPFSDEELIPLSKSKNKFNEINCKILTSNSASLETILNKKKLFNFCKEKLNLDILPKYKICTDASLFMAHYRQIKTEKNLVCVKPSIAHGSRGFRIITESHSDENFFLEKPDPTKVELSQLNEILSNSNKSFREIMVMEYLPGREFSVDCIKIDDEFICIPRSRDTIKEGICTSGVTEKKEDLILASRVLYETLDLKYSCNLQFKYDSNNQAKLLEINPRFSGTMEHCRGAGVNLVEASICNALNIQNKTKYKAKWGTKITRVWKEIFENEGGVFTLD